MRRLPINVKNRVLLLFSLSCSISPKSLPNPNLLVFYPKLPLLQLSISHACQSLLSQFTVRLLQRFGPVCVAASPFLFCYGSCGIRGGAVAGAITGALAGRITDTGTPRGAALGAVAGAVLSLEVLEASRAYWCLEQSGVRGSSTMADFMEELLQERFLSEEFIPSMPTAYPQEVNVASRRNDRIDDVYVHRPIQGLSVDFLKKLPCHVVVK
ncbi:NEP1-interacting protein-like 2 isoform X2 [Tripterygium wilfordii]|uniref:NEP1-interacting protein-like 2 isoform X2 n=1 Tax=Tripterygium wilfordii TaxID=458696 RepID=A0A7J7CJ93_TRIWF|nr:NEP1-interacting protein-like 2 isoform X2 [Tripterygium wilfordii]